MIDVLIDRLTRLEARVTKTRQTLLYATVTQSSPLRIRLDGDDVALDYAPAVLRGETYSVDTRLVCALTGGSLVVVGPIDAAPVEAGWSSAWLTLSPSSGAFANAVGSIRWRSIGKVVHLGIHISIVDKGTAAGHISFTLPSPAPYRYGTSWENIGQGRETAVAGWAFGVEVTGATTVTLLCGGALANGQFLSATVNYEAA